MKTDQIVSVVHWAERKAFILVKDKVRIGKLTYIDSPTTIDANHTFIKPEFRGLDYGIKLLNALREYQLRVGKKVIGSCPYVAKHIDMFKLNR